MTTISKTRQKILTVTSACKVLIIAKSTFLHQHRQQPHQLSLHHECISTSILSIIHIFSIIAPFPIFHCSTPDSRQQLQRKHTQSSLLQNNSFPRNSQVLQITSSPLRSLDGLHCRRLHMTRRRAVGVPPTSKPRRRSPESDMTRRASRLAKTSPLPPPQLR